MVEEDKYAGEILFDCRMPIIFYEMAIRPTTVLSSNCQATKKHLRRMRVAEMRMLGEMRNETQKDVLENVYICKNFEAA